MSKSKQINQNRLNLIRNVSLTFLIFILPLTVYWQVKNFDFINYDDPTYVYKNAKIQQGLTVSNIKWSFTAIVSGNWHPITVLSHMADCQLYGLNPGNHHLTNVFLHLANTFLLFFILWKMTGREYESAFVAALFALHPLHVESVAWISERKDVLSTFFLLLTIWSYIKYIEEKTFYRYLIICLFFIMGLMAKPMLVTLPFVLLLLDLWPLERIDFRSSEKSLTLKRGTKTNSPFILNFYFLFRDNFLLVYEKIPLFALTISSCVITFLSQQSAGAIKSFNHFPFQVRFFNAVVSYTKYITKMIWPSNMAIFYPYTEMFSVWQITISFILLFLISIIAVRLLKGHPYFIVGWFWYLGTLIPVIGLIQVGGQALADRYTYIPFIGLSIIISWGGYELFKKWRLKNFGIGLALLSITIFTVITWNQIRYWRNNTLLYNHTIEVTDNNFIAHHNLGNSLVNQDKIPEAIYNYKKTIQIKPDLAEAHNNLGAALEKILNLKEAIKYYSMALNIQPDYAEAHNNIGNLFRKTGQIEQAIRHLSRALILKPNYAEAHNNIGNVLELNGKTKQAIEHYQKALKIKPDFAVVHNNLGATLMRNKQTDDALYHYNKALQLNPNAPEIHKNFGDALLRK